MQNTRVKLLFFLAVWKRPEITEICFLGLNRLRRQPDYDINVLAVISEESMIPLCEKYGVNWVMHENLPLGKKKNYGLQQALNFEWDYLIEIGSDDLLKNEVLNLYAPHFGHRPVLALDQFVFLNTEDGACRRVMKSNYGIGRAMSRHVIESGKLWRDDLNSGLDNNSTFKLAQMGFGEVRIKSDEPLAIDLKSETNLWEFNYLNGMPYPLEEALKGLSEEEVNAIQSLIHAEAQI